MRVIGLMVLTFLLWISGISYADAAFKTVDIDGWQVDFDQKLISDSPDLMDRIQNKLHILLSEIVRLLPAKRIEELRRIPVYVQTHNSYATLFYGKGGRVIIGNPSGFLSSIDEVPSRILHELAHGYHNQILGIDDPGIKKAFDDAVSAHLYENVRDHKGHIHAKSYARTNKSEYFALLTQAYYERSGYFPFTRDQLKEYDPEGFEVVRTAWEDRDGPQPAVKFQAAVSDDSCSSGQTLKSQESNVPAMLTIRNNTATPLTLWWINYKGKRKMFADIPANGFRKRTTYATHVWEIDNAKSGHCIGITRLGPLGEHIDIF